MQYPSQRQNKETSVTFTDTLDAWSRLFNAKVFLIFFFFKKSYATSCLCITMRKLLSVDQGLSAVWKLLACAIWWTFGFLGALQSHKSISSPQRWKVTKYIRSHTALKWDFEVLHLSISVSFYFLCVLEYNSEGNIVRFYITPSISYYSLQIHFMINNLPLCKLFFF